MIDIDIGKLILLALIALVVLGPEKLPVAARTVGAIMRRMRGGWNSVRAEVERELQVTEIVRAARDASGHVASAQAGLKAAVGQFRESLDGRILNTQVQSMLPLDKAPAESSRQIPLTLACTTAPSSEMSGQGTTTENVPHDVT
jgi:sec-independent protein translocase protein TatB